MRVIRNPRQLTRVLLSAKRKNRSIGFVPTMGALHEGHLSLARRAKRENDLVVASVFVNPLQFGPKEDFKKYPRSHARDARLLMRAGCDILFLPDKKKFYSPSFQTTVAVSRLGKPLCGRARPTHFAGVATVVSKLLLMTRPDRLYLGQKDFQQCRVIEQMIEDLDFGAQVRRCPIVREKDGLAMSSRNAYLSQNQRRDAVLIRKALLEIKRLVREGVKDAARLKRAARAILQKSGLLRIDYVEIVDAVTLSDVLKLVPRRTALCAIAVFFGKTRLIDNILIGI